MPLVLVCTVASAQGASVSTTELRVVSGDGNPVLSDGFESDLNHAPVLDPAASPALAPIDEDSPGPGGPVGDVSGASALLLAADSNHRVYFQPIPDFAGDIPTALTFRAWAQTSGIDGSLASTVPNGGTTAFSVDTDTASLTLTPAQ